MPRTYFLHIHFMKNKPFIVVVFLILSFFLFQSCLNQSKKEEKKEHIITIENSSKIVTIPKGALAIKYAEHKNLLDILTLLPNNTMDSWGWSTEERVELVNFIKENNYSLGFPEHFSKMDLIGPNALGIQVVDGYWILAIYKIKKNNYIVITDDIVGDGNDLHSFEYNTKKLTEIKFESLFDELYISNLLIDKKNSECKSLLDDNQIGFEFDFTSTTILKISNSYYLKKEVNENCLNGNTLYYKFNSSKKKFDLIEMKW